MGDYDHFAGELTTPGQKGWLPLDENGTPIGPATIEPPVAPALACAVVAVELPDDQGIGLQTPSGAEITSEMEHNPDFRLPGSGGTEPEPLPPVITSLTPNSAPVTADLALVISGDDLAGATAVNVAGTPHTPTNASDAQVDVTVPMVSLIEGTHDVTVVTPTGVSNALSLTLTAAAVRRK